MLKGLITSGILMDTTSENYSVFVCMEQLMDTAEEFYGSKLERQIIILV